MPQSFRNVERALTEREADVLLYLAQGDDPAAETVRDQLTGALVLQESGCCASIHLIGNPQWAEGRAWGNPIVVEAVVRERSDLLVRLHLTQWAGLSLLELSHEDSPQGPTEFPSPGELESPEWRQWIMPEDGSTEPPRAVPFGDTTAS